MDKEMKCLCCNAVLNACSGIRGLCRNKCYTKALALVSAKKTTWDKLVKSGKSLESRRLQASEATNFFLGESK